MRTLVLLTACLCGVAMGQRRIAKPIPLGFNPKYSSQPQQYNPQPQKYSAQPQQYSPQPQQYSPQPQQYSPQPSTASPKYNQEYDPAANAVFSTPSPARYQPQLQGDAGAKDYVTPIPIIRFDKEQSIDGSYRASYETGNNIVAEETGFLKNVGVKDQEALVQHGSYSYTSPDGRLITVHYTADEGGFRAQGDHLPTPPPVPAEIQKSLDLIYENIRLQEEAARSDPKLFKLLQEQENGFYSENYPNFRR